MWIFDYLITQSVPIVAGCIIGKEKSFVEKIFGYNGVAVLGMPASGKTSFLSLLSKNIDNSEQTGVVSYDKFIVEDEKLKFKIASNYDIGGGNEFCSDYPAVIKNSDITLFFFDAKRYIQEPEYRRSTNYRLDFICRHDFMSQDKRHGIIGTHLDLIAQEEGFQKNDDRDFHNFVNKQKSIIRNLCSGKMFQKVFLDQYFFVVNMTDKKEAIHIVKKYV